MKIPENIINPNVRIKPRQALTLFKAIKEIGSQFSGNSPPSVFIGSKLPYPKVNVGVLSPPEKIENVWLYDAENYWAEHNYTIDDVINFRSSLINSRFRTSVYYAKERNKLLELSQEIAMAARPVDLEINLKDKIKFKLDYNSITLPMGPRANLQKLRITENTEIAQKVEKVVSDTDLKANDAINYLYKNKFDENTLSQLLSIGVLGIKKNRKLVPTRWSITSVDDMLAKSMIKSIKTYDTIDSYTLFFGHFLGNYFMIMLFPRIFSYELFEIYVPGSSWNPGTEIAASTDYEDVFGRKDYASNTVGGYYANRLAVTEYLTKIKKQASILTIRFETPEYWKALGVWVVRAASRKAMLSNPIKFDSMGPMLSYIRELSSKRFSYDIDYLLGKSKLLKSIKEQPTLFDF